MHESVDKPPPGKRLTEYSSDVLNRLFETVSDGVVVFDAEGRVAACNAGMALIAGQPIEQLIGTRPSDWSGHTPWCGESEALTSSEGTIVRPDGRMRRVTVKGFVVPGDPPFRAAAYRDVTSLYRARSTHGGSEEQARHLVENVNDGILVHRDEQIVYVNERLAAMLGYERGELLMQPLGILQGSQSPNNAPEVGDPPARYDTVCLRKDGSLLHVEVSVSTSIHDGREAVFEVMRDVTQRRATEKRAAAFLALGQMLNSASTPKDAALAMLRAAEGLMPYDACTLEIIDEAHGTLVPIVFMDTVAGVRTEVPAPLAGPGDTEHTRRVLAEGPRLILRKSPPDEGAADGFRSFGDTARPSLSLMFVPIGGAGGTMGVLSLQSYQVNAYTSADLEVLQALADYCAGALERTRAVAELRASEARYREMFQGNSAIQLILDPEDGAILEANGAAAEFYGYSSDEFCTGMTILQLIPEPKGKIWQEMREVLHSRRGFFPMCHRLAGGELRDVEVHLSPVCAHKRTLLHAIIQDVSERNRAVARGRAFAELGHRLSAATSVVEVGRVALEIAQRLIGWDAGFIDLLTSELEAQLPAGKMLVPVIHYDRIGEEVREVAPVRTVLQRGSISDRTLREGPLLLLRRPDEIPGPGLVRYGDTSRSSSSLMFVPIHGSAGVLGVISLQSYRWNAYAAEDLTVLQMLADHCSGALERTRTEEQLRLLESAVRLATDMVVISATDPTGENGTQIIFVNDAFVRHTGWTRSEIIGRPASILYGPLTDPEDVERQKTALQAGRPVTMEMINYRRDGTPYDVEFSAFPIADSFGVSRYFVSVQRDVTERRHTQRQLAWRAFHDPLTSLANRSLFRERLEHAMARRQRSAEETFAVLYLDLDTFKEINDRYGHAAGDQVLIQVARRLEGCVRPGDTVARLGGDEFIILLEGTDRLDDVLSVADRILAAIREPLDVGGFPLICGTSIGIAPPDLLLADPDEIIHRADEALYRAKAGGKDRYYIAVAEV